MRTIIIGCAPGQKAEMEAHLREMNLHERVEIVELEEKPPVIDELKESIHMFDTKSMHVPFTPKKKHMPKGHQRPYRYHP